MGAGTKPQPEIEPVDVLLVDDRRQDLLALMDVLDGMGCSLTTAQSGQDALRHVLRQNFAVIVLDVVMPQMSGFELATIIKKRERSRNIPLIFLTAAGSGHQAYRGYSVGAVDFLPKPVDPEVLRAKVRVFAELYRKDRDLQRQSLALKEAEARERELQLAALSVVAERRYRNLADAIPHIVWTANPAGELTYANAGWTAYTGKAASDAQGMHWLSVIHEQDVSRCAEVWKACVQRGEVFEFEARVRRASDATFRWHVCRAIPERSDDGAVVAWLGTWTDFEDLKQALHSRDDFLAIASHELRTPLTTLKLRIEGLRVASAFPSSLRERIDSATKQVGRLEKLIGNLLDMSRITTGNLSIEPEQLDLVTLVGSVVERFTEEADGANTSVRLSAPEKIQGSWDGLRIEQVVGNLLSNALQHAQSRSVIVELISTGSSVKLCVSDDGIGIEAGSLQHVFERIQLPRDRLRSSAGLGMGLYISKSIVEAHGGTIEAQSTPGSGSTFRVTLPLDSAS